MSGKIKVLVEGASAFNIECTVSADELKQWDAERITRFFDGVSAVLKAKYGEASAAPRGGQRE